MTCKPIPCFAVFPAIVAAAFFVRNAPVVFGLLAFALIALAYP
ncbi:MAG: hypothetical protein AB7V13_03480 [Pseudorhodoplanes sp.]